ncbi:MAG: penicillin-binding protein 1C [Reichenbachiella sp.]|uniref:penicillin-binding protein 1C n=1 Tax=Reichenbachiella sp. TaxID=2184521 RepID=UPI0032970715
MKNKIESVLKNRLVQLLMLGSVLFLLLPLPDPLFDQPYTTTIESSEGQLMGARIANDGQWRFPMVDSLPIKFETALLYFEDEYFYYHPGVNPVSIFKAFITNVKTGSIKRGGSTLSMQVIRMARGNQSRTVFQKLWETLLALKLELFYSKKEIINLYASHAPFGGNVVGISAASWRYFSRAPEQLSWAEAAALAVLPNQPSIIFPGKNDEAFRTKRNKLLTKLFENNLIDATTLELAQAEELPSQPHDLPQFAPHLLGELVKKGKSGQRNVVTLNPRLQQTVNRLLKSHIAHLNANYIFNGAVLVVDLLSGETKAYVGNVDTEEIHSPSVDIIQSKRSTGSLLKPFLYAAALDEGLITPKQLLGDYPVFFEGFAPKNFDLQYRGAVHADEALTRSLNLPFVMLLKEYGYQKFHQKLRRIGMNSLDRPADHYGLSMILGGAESSLWELVNMYANLYRVYRNSFDQSITTLYLADNYFEHEYLVNQPLRQIPTFQNPEEFSIASTWSMLEAMKGLNRPDDFAGWEQFRSSTPISWKTGTSFGFRDAWAIGLNGRYAVGVWVGNADGEGRPGLVGGKAAAPLMFQVFEQLESDPFDEVPTSETQLFKICKESGQKANSYCENTMDTSLPMSIDHSTSCSFHQLIHLDQTETYQVNSSCYDVNQMVHKSWFMLPPVQAWYYRQYNTDYQSPPKFKTGCEQATSIATLEMIYPKANAKVFIPKELDGTFGQTVFEAAHSNTKEIIYWHLDGVYLGSTKRVHQMGLFAEPGKHELHLLDGQGQELNLNFTVIGVL